MFARKTVDSVLKVFTKALSDLEQVEREHAQEATFQRGLAANANFAAVSADSEADRAGAIATKIRAIVQ